MEQKHGNRLRRCGLKQQFASYLRQESTEAERRLWSILRSHRTGGLRFRRQQPIGPYIVDFYCSLAKLIIELDGDQHGSDQHALHDEERTQWLSARGYTVLRFPNRVVFQNPQGIVDAVVHHLNEHDIPLPGICCANSDPPSRGGVGMGCSFERGLPAQLTPLIAATAWHLIPSP